MGTIGNGGLPKALGPGPPQPHPPGAPHNWGPQQPGNVVSQQIVPHSTGLKALYGRMQMPPLQPPWGNRPKVPAEEVAGLARTVKPTRAVKSRFFMAGRLFGRFRADGPGHDPYGRLAPCYPP